MKFFTFLILVDYKTNFYTSFSLVEYATRDYIPGSLWKFQHGQREILRILAFVTWLYPREIPAFLTRVYRWETLKSPVFSTWFCPWELPVLLTSLCHWRNHMGNHVYNFSFVWQFLAAKLGVGTGSSGPFSASSFAIGFGADRGALTWRGSSGLIETCLLFNEFYTFTLILVRRNSQYILTTFRVDYVYHCRHLSAWRCINFAGGNQMLAFLTLMVKGKQSQIGGEGETKLSVTRGGSQQVFSYTRQLQKIRLEVF